MSTESLAASVEGLNSSLALTASDLWPKRYWPVYSLARLIKG